MSDSEQNTLLSCDGLVKIFAGVTAVDHVNMSLSQGELLAILGPSGCGKSTLLRMIAGLSQPDAGTIHYQDKIWANGHQFIKPEQRDCGMVFQDMALFPHLSIGDNIGFAIQQQRVALARSLAPGPGLLLMDEPFSSLDLRLRQVMRRDVRNILKRQGVASILVTHDQNEAFAFADTVAVMFQIEMEKALVLFPDLQNLEGHLQEANNVFMCRPEDVVVNRGGCRAEVLDMEFQGCWRELTISCTNNNCQADLMVRSETTRSWRNGDKLTAVPLCGCIYSPDGQLLGTASFQE